MSHRNKPAAKPTTQIHEKSAAERVRHVLTTWGRKESVVSVAAAVPAVTSDAFCDTPPAARTTAVCEVPRQTAAALGQRSGQRENAGGKPAGARVSHGRDEALDRAARPPCRGAEFACQAAALMDRDDGKTTEQGAIDG